MGERRDIDFSKGGVHDYHRTAGWLESLIDLPIYDHRDFPAEKGQSFVLGLRRFVDFLGALDISIEGGDGPEITHVAGTSGKGSVSAFLAAVLFEEEKTRSRPRGVGAFFSPHVSSLTERTWSDGKLIDPAGLDRIVERMKPHIQRAYLEGKYGIPSYFEITLALALLHFRARAAGRVILEVGLGGTYDATNVFAKTALSIITKIGLDHTDILGSTIEQIAAEKAGIVKPGGLVLSGVQTPRAQRVIREVCAERKARLISLNDTPLGAAAGLRETRPDGSVFDFLPDPVTSLTSIRNLEIRIPGSHQVQNACLAAAAAQLHGVGEEAIRRGLAKTRLPARVEVVGDAPTVVLDGAHNPDKARALRNALDLAPASGRFFVLGVLGDKDVDGLCEVLLPESAGVFVTRPSRPPRPACDPKRLAEAASRFSPVRGVFLNPFDAVEAALNAAGEDDLVCVTGSLFLAGEVRERWRPLRDILREGTSFPEAPEPGKTKASGTPSNVVADSQGGAARR